MNMHPVILVSSLGFLIQMCSSATATTHTKSPKGKPGDLAVILHAEGLGN